MAVRVQINRAQFDRLVQKVLTSQVMAAVIDAAALEVKGEISEYPPQRHDKQPFVSDKQRKAFFAKLRNKEIESPYRRGQSPGSQKLGQSWTTARRGALSRVIGTNVSYAKWVQGEEQSAYHLQTGWRKASAVIELSKPRVEAILLAGVKRMI